MSKFLRDFEWLIRSPGLIASTSFSFVDDPESEAFWHSLKIPSTLQLSEAVQKKPRTYKLGIYAEALLEAAIQNSSSYEWIASNLPIYRGREALGEFDFILNHQSHPEHWELAVKFYCLTRETIDSQPLHPSELLGPEGRDTLEMKMGKVVQRQLLLSKTEEGRAALRNLGVEQAPLPRLYSRGRFFYYWKIFDRAQVEKKNPQAFFKNDFISPQALSGWWCRRSEIHARLKHIAKCALVERIEWMTGPEEYFSTAQTLQKIESLFTENDDTIQIWCSDGTCGFVMRDAWARS